MFMEYMLSLPFVDGDSKVSRVRSWLSKVASQDTAASTLTARPESPPALSLRQRTRQRSASYGSDTTLTNFASAASNHANEQILNSSRIDTAIALALRAKQMDQEGNSEDAVRLFAVCLENMSLSLEDLDRIRAPHVRERLVVLRLLLASDTAISSTANAEWRNMEPEITVILEPRLNCGRMDDLTATLRSAAACGLDLMNQLVIAWLILLGNVILWASAKFKSSSLPEVLAGNLSSMATWGYSTALKWHVYDHALWIGRTLAAWLSSVDNETKFSRKVICSAAAILGAVARVTEQSTNDISQQEDFK